MKEKLDALNRRLEAACVPYRVRLNGKYLTIRGMLPCKVGDGPGRKQYDLSLGIPATATGLKQAERLCHRLSDAVVSGSFRWEDWQNPRRQKVERIPTVAELVEGLQASLPNVRSGKCSAQTWEDTWAATFRHLPQDEPINEAMVLAVVLSKQEDTQIRRQTCLRLQRLADFAGLSLDLSIYKGDYGPSSVQPRLLPSDELIEQWFERIPNLDWRWVYGVSAAFGLRPHEAFFCEFEDTETLFVSKSKTEQHRAKALRPDWVRDWGLQQVERPDVTGSTLRAYGQRVRSAYGRYGLPMQPYDLRHAYAIRGVRLGLNPPEMARWMGHSEQVHIATYRRWLDKETTDRIYREKIGFS
ncbi:MAG: hypothetical protein ACKO7W_09070 [Elainella sp.]